MDFAVWCIVGAFAALLFVVAKNTLYVRRKLLEYYADKGPSHATATSLDDLHRNYPQIEKARFKQVLSAAVQEVRNDDRPVRRKGDPTKRGVYAQGDKMWEVGRESINFAGPSLVDPSLCPPPPPPPPPPPRSLSSHTDTQSLSTALVAHSLSHM